MDLDPEAMRILQLAREARTPSALDKARLDRTLAVALGLTATSAAGTATAVTAGKLAGMTLALKCTAGIAVVALAAGGGYSEWRAASRSRAVLAAPVAAASAKVAATPALTVPVAPVARENERPSANVPAAGPGLRATRVDRAEPSKTALAEELDLLHDVQAKWRRGDAAAALGLLAQHRRRFPRSQLGPERDALTILSLCAVGRTAQARKLAERFLRSAARSPLRASVEESCGGR